MSSRLSLGVDIGGTKVAFALVDENGHVTKEHRLPTQPSAGLNAMLDSIAQGIEQLLPQAQWPVTGIGIGSPGQVDPVTGCVRNAVNLGWDEVSLRDELQKRLSASLPIMVEKDANAAALGEMHFGAAKGYKDFILIAIGTGLGGGAVLGGKILHGGSANALEIGHLALDPKGRLCNCGIHGCPEMYISGVGLLAGYAAHKNDYPASTLFKGDTSTADILQAARAGDALAVHIIDEAGDWLGRVMTFCAAVANPTRFLIGGGLGHAAADLLLPRAERAFQTYTLPATHNGVTMATAQVMSPAVGAACLVWDADL